PAEPAVETIEEAEPVFFVEMEQAMGVAGAVAVGAAGIGETFAGEDEAEIAGIVPDGLTVGERTLVAGPARAQAELRLEQGAESVKAFVLHRAKHGFHIGLANAVRGKYSGNTWHLIESVVRL